MDAEYDVALVGAGVAGLGAARLLARFGLHCCLLEAAPVIGGRLRTLRRPGWQMPIELGAEFVHGRPGPTLALDGGAIGLVAVPEHRVIVDPEVRPLPATWSRFANALAGARDAAESESVAQYLDRATLLDADQQLVRMIVEGYHAAATTDVSAQTVARDAQNVAADFRQYRTAHGYDAVLSSLEHALTGCHIELGARVQQVAWRPGQATLDGVGRNGPFRLRARRAVITVSLGVLQAPVAAGGIVFDPLPSTFQGALRLLAMGHALRVVLRFENAPWLTAAGGVEATFVHVPDAPFDTLWREARAGQVQITAWAGGPRALRLSRLEEPVLLNQALASVALATRMDAGTCRARLIEAHYHDFNRDPLTFGAYSYVRPSGQRAAEQLATPWEDTIFFAGEALDFQYPSTVAGALGSGERAARRVLTAWAS